MNMKTFFNFIFGIVLLFFLLIILAIPTMLLWNWLMPSIFGLTDISIWQAIGITFLSAILFGHKLNIN